MILLIFKMVAERQQKWLRVIKPKFNNQLLKTRVFGIKICQETIYVHTHKISYYMITTQFSTAFAFFPV